MHTRTRSPQDHADEPRLIFPIEALRQAEQAASRDRRGVAGDTRRPRPSPRARGSDRGIDAETRRLLRSVEKTLDRLQQGVDELVEEVRHYRFPTFDDGPHSPSEHGDDRPRAA
jgi:uncharacterized protein involved in exopolysaccharide biosynthesis